MRRTENMKFSDLSDYDYSEGETSEDMKIQFRPLSRGSSSGKFTFQPTGFHLPIERQLELVDPSFGGRNLPSKYPFPFPCGDGRAAHDSAAGDAEPVECVIFSMTRPVQYRKVQSDYIHGRLPIVAWAEATPAVDPKALHAFYKACYQGLRSQVRFLPHVPPSTEKFATVASIRRDVPSGRIVFHYVGYGYPPMDAEGIYASDPKTLAPGQCPLKNIFTGIKPPSWYILDCDNAGAALGTFEKTAKELMGKNTLMPSSPISSTPAFLRQIDWGDYYCMCATDVGEEIPMDPRLPRDLLSTILATPVPAAILFHILEFYRTSFPNPDFPFSHLRTVLAHESPEQANLSSILSATIDSIAVESFNPQIFAKLFRKDTITSVYFSNFVLARFLLDSYDIHPQCNPQLPDTNRHPLWRQWQTAADLWISSTLTPKPPLRINFFANAITTLDSFLKLNRQNEVTSGLLTVICHAPFADASCSKAFSLLAEYCASGKQCVEKLLTPFLYGASAARLCDFDSDAHPIVYLLLMLANADSRLINEISPSLDVSKLIKALNDDSLQQETRSLIAAFLVITVDRIRGSRSLMSGKIFIEELTKTMKNASPFLLTWLLLLIGTSFQHNSIELNIICDSAIHLQIAAAIRHQAIEVRSTALLALSTLLQPDDDAINCNLLLHAAPAIADGSSLIRNSLLIFLLRFIEYQNSSIVNFYSPQKLNQRYDTFSSFIAEFVPRSLSFYSGDFLGFKDFSSYSMAVDCAVKEMSSLSKCDNLSLWLLQQLSFDPDQAFSLKVKSALNFTKKLLDGNPHEYSDDESADLEEPPSSHILESTLLNQISRTRLYFPGPYLKIPDPPQVIRDYGAFELTTAHLQLRAQSRLPAKPLSVCSIPGVLGLGIASDDGFFRVYDDSFSYATEFNLGKVCGCTSFSNDSHSYLAALSETGCVSVISHKTMKMLSTYSIDLSHDEMKGFITTQDANILGCRGYGNISLWDTNTSLCAGEWRIGDHSSKPSAFCAHPTLEGVVIVGFDNGSVKALDTRENAEKPLIITLDGSIVSITGKDDGLVYIGSTNGRVLVWDARTNIINTCSPRFSHGIRQFTAHKKLPFFVLSSPSEMPIVCRPDLSISHVLSAPVQPGNMFALSDEYPVICFLSEAGNIMSYNLIQ